MSNNIEIEIPVKKFRKNRHKWQIEVLKKFNEGYRFFIINWHRRARKSTLAINILIKEALKNKNCVYAYIAPTQRQAREIIWENPNMLFSYLPNELIKRKSEQQLTIEFINGSILKIIGADDPDKLRGIDVTGIVFDEWAVFRHAKFIWQEIFKPIMSQKISEGQSKRWAMFLFTPKGQNEAYRMWNAAKNDQDWFTSELTADKTDLISKEELEKDRLNLVPAIYDQEYFCKFITDEESVLITSAMIEKLKGRHVVTHFTREIISCDPATGGDECVIQVFRNSNVIDMKILHERDTMKICGELMNLSYMYKIDDFIIDIVGLGKGIGDRMVELKKRVQFFGSGEGTSEENKNRFLNLKTEAWFYARNLVEAKEVEFIEDDKTRQQICTVKIEISGSTGKIKMQSKADYKAEYNESHDRADAWIMGIWGLQFVVSKKEQDKLDNHLNFFIEERRIKKNGGFGRGI